VEAPSTTGAQLPPHLQDRHDYLTSGPDMNFNVCGDESSCHQPTSLICTRHTAMDDDSPLSLQSTLSRLLSSTAASMHAHGSSTLNTLQPRSF